MSASRARGCLRQIAFLGAEIAIVGRAIAERALVSPEIRRLLTVPGVDMITAATGRSAPGIP
jgi:transposase